jgi:LysR family cys regulon transcriptional activator
MTLRQLRFIREIVDRELSISRAAEALHTSQPSVSRQIQALEEELGFSIFRRSRRRILGITPRGEEVVRIARAIERLSDDLKRMGRDVDGDDSGDLTIAASHTHARYSLPDVIERFMQQYPQVKLVLRQGDPSSMADLLGRGEADLLISAKPVEPRADILFLPCRRVHRIILAPKSHPICSASRVTLKQLARYPLITYDKAYEAHGQVRRAFADAGLEPNIVLTATDIGVMKTYVERGMGLAIVASIAHRPSEDRPFCVLDAGHLFAPNTVHIGLRRDAYVPSYVYTFISMFEPGLTRAKVAAAARQ